MNNLLELSDLASKQSPINPEKVLSNVAVGSTNSVSSEDRKIIREKMKTAYRKKSTTYDELLELCTLVNEEHVFKNAPSKLDYYKTGINCVKTIFEKKSQIDADEQEVTNNANKTVDDVDSVPKSLKRAKTQH